MGCKEVRMSVRLSLAAARSLQMGIFIDASMTAWSERCEYGMPDSD